MKRLTAADAPAAILLEFGAILSILVVAMAARTLLDPWAADPMPPGLPGNIAIGVTSIVLAVVGFGWMLRIACAARATRDEARLGLRDGGDRPAETD